MPKLTIKAIRYGQTDPNDRKSSLLKRYMYVDYQISNFSSVFIKKG